MKQGILLFITTIILGISACQKADNTEVQPEEVIINITSPREGQIFRNSDTINIAADIDYISMMHGYIVSIKAEDGTTVYETEGHNHSDHITVDEQWINTLSANHNLTLEITAVIDHKQSLKNAKVSFNSQP